MSSEQQVIDLIGRLHAATRAGRAKWGAESNFSFLLTVPSGSVRVGSVDKDGSAPYELIVSDENGVAVESVRSTWYHDPEAEEWEGEPAAWNIPLKDLYETARSSALNIDKVIAGILKDVDENKAIDPDEIPF